MAPAKKKQDKQPQGPVTCMTCAKCQLLQWGNDPIISECEPKHSREVARPFRTCGFYEMAKSLPKPIKHLPKTAGITSNTLEFKH